MHTGRTDTGTYAQSTYACRCSVAMVKLEVVHFIAETVHTAQDMLWQLSPIDIPEPFGCAGDATVSTLSAPKQLHHAP